MKIRRGMSLLEVLASIGVLSVGLLGLAALLPVGQYIINQATMADHAGDCGRAGLRDIVVRRMLASAPAGGTAAFAIDSVGTGQFGGSLNIVAPPAGGGTTSTDDLVENLPPYGRPTTALNYNGGYSWFATVTPAPGSSTRFTVSVVVCSKRDGSTSTGTIPAGTPAAGAAGFLDAGIGGGSVCLSAALSTQLQANNWVALCGGGLCYWYRVAAVGDDGTHMTLVGPDWNPATAATLVAVGQSVLGVYTTTLELDTDPTWQR